MYSGFKGLAYKIVLFKPVYTSTKCKLESLFSRSSPTLVGSFLFDTSHLTTGSWNLTLVLFCLSLMISNIEHLIMCLLAICVLLQKNVRSGPLPIFEKKNLLIELYALFLFLCFYFCAIPLLSQVLLAFLFYSFELFIR